MNDSKALKAVLAGVGGGMVASWAVTRFYRLARRSSGAHPILRAAAAVAEDLRHFRQVIENPRVPALNARAI